VEFRHQIKHCGLQRTSISRLILFYSTLTVWDVDFSNIDYLFATSSHDRTARIWSTDRVTPLRVLAGHLSDVDCVKFHPNSNYVKIVNF
jgi:WD40 repeat protein